jgi:hypothetical protein
MQSSVDGVVHGTAGGLLTDDVMTEVRVQTTARSDVLTIMLNNDLRDVTRCSG